MELTKKQRRFIEEVAIFLGVRTESLMRALEKYEVYWKIYGIEEVLDGIILDYGRRETIFRMECKQAKPYRPKTKPGKVYKRKIYWKRIRSNPRQR